jgi:hypothetical protein
MIASAMPPTMPISIDSTVRINVLLSPLRTGPENRYRPTTSQRNPSLVRIVLTSIAASTASTAIAPQRPGCRTGTALIGVGAGAEPEVGPVPSAVVSSSGRARPRESRPSFPSPLCRGLAPPFDAAMVRPTG